MTTSTKFANHVSIKRVGNAIVNSQMTEIPGREKDMVRNNAGGFVFAVDPFDHLLRFLILGTEGGTYYSSEEKHTYQAFDNMKACIRQDAKRVVDLVVEVSDQGRAANNDPALFTLAVVMALGTAEEKFYARSQLNKVARIGTHLFHFAQFVDLLKGWGTGTRKAFQQWYLQKSPEEIAFQYVKYGQRDGWSHRDILRKAHPVGTENQNNVFSVIAHPEKIEEFSQSSVTLLPTLMYAAHEIKAMKNVKSVVQMIKDHRLPREAIPTEFLNDKLVWEALLPNMKPAAMIRSLGKMTSLGMLQPMSDNAKYVASVLTNQEQLKNARMHPLNVLKALKTYQLGKGIKGSLTWKVSNTVAEALEDAFHKSFNFVQPSGKNIMVALDVSGSMTMYTIPGLPNMTCREAAAAMALATVKAEQNVHVMAFSNTFIELNITKADSFQSADMKVAGLPFSSTDCSLPMLYATKNDIPVDCFQVYTDNETFAGKIHASEALKMYRQKANRPRSKMAVVAFTASKFTIADPTDPFMLDFVGFDANAPQAMAELAKM